MITKAKTITITIKGGCVIEVSGLPEDCNLKIVDLDLEEVGCYAKEDSER